eukprot:COSAG03_NODE_18034_length_363_cov_0.905303_1_plen_51_part_00
MEAEAQAQAEAEAQAQAQVKRCQPCCSVRGCRVRLGGVRTDQRPGTIVEA